VRLPVKNTEIQGDDNRDQQQEADPDERSKGNNQFRFSREFRIRLSAKFAGLGQ
jgi:hypothetical protein